MAPSITLYTFPPSQNAVRAEIALREKGLAFTKVPVDLLSGAHREPPLSDLTPRTQVPTLVYEHRGAPIVVYESIATVRFIDAMHPEPPLMPPPRDPTRLAAALMRIEEFQTKLDPKNIFGSVVFAGKGRDELAPRIEALVKELALWEHYLADRMFLAGDQFTLADIAVFPLLMHFAVLGFPFGERAPNLAGYIDRCQARESVVATGWIDTLHAFVTPRISSKVLADNG